jgi:hypothetical protein
MVIFAVYPLVYRTGVIYSCRKRKRPIYSLNSYAFNYNTRWNSLLYAIFGLATGDGLRRTPLLYRAAKATLYRCFVALLWPFLPLFVWLNSCHGSSLDLILGHVTVNIHSEGAILVHWKEPYWHIRKKPLAYLEEAIHRPISG